jgi:hypothetical protein
MACVPILRRFFLLFRTSAVAAAGPLVAFTRATVVVLRVASLDILGCMLVSVNDNEWWLRRGIRFGTLLSYLFQFEQAESLDSAVFVHGLWYACSGFTVVVPFFSYHEGLSHGAEVGVGLMSEGDRRGLGMQVQMGCSKRYELPGARLFDLAVGWYGGHVVGSHRPSGYVGV